MALTTLSVLVVTTCENPLQGMIEDDVRESNATYFKLTIDKVGNGSINPNGTIEVVKDEEVTIKANPSSGAALREWKITEGKGVTIEDANATKTTVVLTKEDAQIEAHFYVPDTTAPSIAIATPDHPQNIANSVPIPVTVTFSEEVTGFNESDLQVTNADIANFNTGDNTVFTCVLENPSDDPTTITSPESPGPTNADPIPVTITFSQQVTGFELGDILFTNCTASSLNDSNPEFSLDIVPTTDGTVEVTVPAGVAYSPNTLRENLAGSFSIVSDREIPPLPTDLDLVTADDTGTFQDDNITKKTSGITFSGEAEPGTTIHLISDFDGELDTTVTDGQGNWDVDVSLTTTAPNAPNVGITGTTASPTEDLTPTWEWESGGGDGEGWYLSRLDNSNRPTTLDPSESTSWTPSSGLSEDAHTLFVWERDVAGNWSNDGSHEIEVDVLPTASFILMDQTDSSTTLTDDWPVIVDSTASSNVTEMRIKNSTDTDFGNWDTYNDEFTWDLAGGDGNRTVEIEYRDAQNNVVSDSCSILLKPSWNSVNFQRLAAWPMTQTAIDDYCSAIQSGCGLQAGEGFVVKVYEEGETDPYYVKVLVTNNDAGVLTVDVGRYKFLYFDWDHMQAIYDNDFWQGQVWGDGSSTLYIDLWDLSTSSSQQSDSDISMSYSTLVPLP